jgi:hypothetical protein
VFYYIAAIGATKGYRKEEVLTKLYTMSLKSQLAAVRILAIENLNTCEF